MISGDSTVAVQALQGSEDGSIPISPLQFHKRDWWVAGVDQDVARELVKREHYACGASNTATYLHALYPRNWVWYRQSVGIAWWIPPSRIAAEAWAGKEYWKGVLSLSRLAIEPHVPANAASFLLAHSVRQIDGDRWHTLVTYADSWRGHTGTIYHAAGWEYCGETKPEAVYTINGVMTARIGRQQEPNPRRNASSRRCLLRAALEGPVLPAEEIEMNDITQLDSRFAGDTGAAMARAPAGQATQVEQARAIAEVRAAVMIAMESPRNQSAAIAQMREVCAIPALAERAFFRVPRGGEMVNGETIHLARELARVFGNISYGVKELARDDIRGQSELLAYAWDLEHNTRSEIVFIVPHVKGKNQRRLVSTQEVYENNASFAGRRLREAIFSVLPVWFKAEAAEICHKTLESGGGKPLVQRVADLRAAFEAIGVTVAQLERKRGRKIDEFLPEDVAGLRVVYGSIKREEVSIAEEFPAPETARPAAAAGDRLDALERAAVAQEQGQAPSADEEEIPFGPTPLNEQSPADDPQERSGADALAGHAAPERGNSEQEQGSLLAADDGRNPLFVPPPPRDARPAQWDHYERQIEALIAEPGQNVARARAANQHTMARLKDEDYDRYQRVGRLLRGQAAADA